MPAALKILYMLHDSRRSGVPAVAASFIRYAAAAGVEPTVLFAHDGVYSEELSAAGIQVVTLGARTPFFWRFKRFLMNLLLIVHGRKFDLIHIHSTQLLWSVLFARMLGLRVVYHLHELPHQIGLFLRMAIAAADCVVFCSQTCAAHFAGVTARKRQTIVNAMQFHKDPPLLHDKGNHRIVMAASINRNKGQDLLLEAFALLDDPKAELWLYGAVGLSARGYVKRLKKRVSALGLENRVHFPGPTSNVHEVFSGAAVVVHTSWTESFGMALVEAMSCGVPVIAHDLEGMAEVVVDGVTGYLIKPGDIEMLVSRLGLLLEDPEIRNRIGGAAYLSVRERFDIISRSQEYRNLYQGLCQS